jgi:hypothetical protein
MSKRFHVFFRTSIISFKDCESAYVRDCYYRIILELLLSSYIAQSRAINRFVVLGNPGIGKTVLCFLFIRVLLELGVDVFCFTTLFFDYAYLFSH